jgi:glutathione synthase/RimK-type ligase-like ATP-grasp enzyme
MRPALPKSEGIEIALATHAAAPEATPDDCFLIPSLAERLSARVTAVPWDAPDVDWGRFDAVLIRSTWNYHLSLQAFLAWTERVEAAGATLWNPAPVVRWNADKRYLLELEAAGVAVVPTEIILRGGANDECCARLRAVLQRRGWDCAVVKPTVSATSFRTFMTRAAPTAEQAALLETLLADTDAMVQPCVSEVQREGEWSFMFIVAPGGGLAFSHAVLKRSGRQDFRVQPEFGGTAMPAVPSTAVLGQAVDAVEALCELAPAPPLYARCDGVVSDGTHAPAGTLLLMEAELIEPVLFLGDAPGAADRFAEGLTWMLRAARKAS